MSRKSKLDLARAGQPVTREMFLQAFMRNLILAKNKYPETYLWPDVDVLQVFRAFVQSFTDGTFSRHGHAVKWTCKELGIENDRTFILKLFQPVDTGGGVK
jgi:hypothetical protein